ncbi:MAG: energy transducer TonB [Bacteroidales bacterium]
MKKIFRNIPSLMPKLMVFVFMIVLGANLNAQVDKSDKDGNVVYTVVDKEASYPGGAEAMTTFLAQNIIYPTLAKQKNTQGKVILSFIVEKDGSISNIKIIRDIGEGCGEEGVRIVKLMPKWKPAQQGGKSVRQQFVLPVSFRLTK